MLQPIGDYVNIKMLPEKAQFLIVDKEPLSFATVKSLPPDISTVLQENSNIVIMDQKKIRLEDELFIHIDYIFLHK